MTIDATTVVPAILVSAYGIFALFGWCLARAASIQDAAERRMWRTLHTRSCFSNACRGRIWEKVVRDYDPELGWHYDIPQTCPACLQDESKGHEFDYDTMKPGDFARALDREHDAMKESV